MEDGSTYGVLHLASELIGAKRRNKQNGFIAIADERFSEVARAHIDRHQTFFYTMDA